LSQKHGPKHKVFVTSFFFAFLMNVKQIATKQLLGVPAFDKKVQFCPKKYWMKMTGEVPKKCQNSFEHQLMSTQLQTCTILQLFFVIIHTTFIYKKYQITKVFIMLFASQHTCKNGYVKLYTMFILSKK
jgi:hypothetical protein